MKQCPKCQLATADEKNVCPRCNANMNEPTRSTPTGDWAVTKRDSSIYKSHEPVEKWPFILAVLLPAVGLIVGLIFLSQKRLFASKIIGVSLLFTIIWALLGAILFSFIL